MFLSLKRPSIGVSQVCLVALSLMAGCATGLKTVSPRERNSFPEDGLVIQRAILTARGRQFTLNGYLALSKMGGKRLIITENFGNVLADVLVKPDGAVHVMRSSAAFRPAWIQRYVAADLECIFGDSTDRKCRAQMLSLRHYVVERFWYKLDLQILEVKAGVQPPAMFDTAATGIR